MKKSLNHFLSFFALAAVLMLASCGDDGELPIPGDDSITLSTDDDAIEDDTLRAAPGEAVNITASLGVGSTGEITVVSDDPSVVEVPTPNTITSGNSITVTIPEGAESNAMATLTFSSEGINEQLTVVVGYESVLDYATRVDSLSTFVEAVQAAGLEEELNGAGPFTVFAPSNQAFTDLLDNLGITLEELISGEDLESILLYHVTSEGALTSSELEDGQEIATSHPDGLTAVVTIDGETVMINSATVVVPNVGTNNGVVHIIDEVLFPQTVYTYQAVLLEAPTGDRASESFFSASNGETYTVDEVINSTESLSDSVDFGYYYGATENASLAAPSDYPTDIYNLGPSGANWTTLNETMFVPANNFTSDDFDDIQDTEGYVLAQEYEVGAAAGDPTPVITDLNVGDLYVFMTASGQYGMLRVDDIVATADSNGQITLTVKATTNE